MIANAELNLGDIVLQQGDLVLAREYFDKVYRLTHDPATSDWMKWRYSMHLFASLGDFWLARGDLPRAQESVAQCRSMPPGPMPENTWWSWRLQGEIALARQQWDEAAGWLQQALALAQDIGHPTQLWKTHLALGRWYSATQRPEHAKHQKRHTRSSTRS